MLQAYPADMSESARTPDSWVGEPFAVSHILADELPAALGTVAAPRVYQVSAIFTRRPPHPLELQLLDEPAVSARLAEAGYPTVRLLAEDRRLLIDGSNLHELQDGLARVIGQLLADIGQRVAAEREANRVAPRRARPPRGRTLGARAVGRAADQFQPPRTVALHLTTEGSDGKAARR